MSKTIRVFESSTLFAGSFESLHLCIVKAVVFGVLGGSWLVRDVERWDALCGIGVGERFWGLVEFAG